MDDDLEEVRKIADHIHIPTNRFETFNRLSKLPHSKQKMRKALKERMRQLAAIYISTATFIDDDEIEFFVSYPKHPRSREIAQRVTEAIEKATMEMRRFRLIPKVKKSSRKSKEKVKGESSPPLRPQKLL